MTNNKLENTPTSSPVIITDTARDHIRSFLKPLGEQAGFCIGVKKSGCSGYAYIADVAERPAENALCLLENGVRLFVDKASVPVIQGTVVDVLDKGMGQKQLCFNNPNVEDSCGCGESFTVKATE